MGGQTVLIVDDRHARVKKQTLAGMNVIESDRQKTVSEVARGSC